MSSSYKQCFCAFFFLFLHFVFAFGQLKLINITCATLHINESWFFIMIFFAKHNSALHVPLPVTSGIWIPLRSPCNLWISTSYILVAECYKNLSIYLCKRKVFWTSRKKVYPKKGEDHKFICSYGPQHICYLQRQTFPLKSVNGNGILTLFFSSLSLYAWANFDDFQLVCSIKCTSTCSRIPKQKKIYKYIRIYMQHTWNGFFLWLKSVPQKWLTIFVHETFFFGITTLPQHLQQLSVSSFLRAALSPHKIL